MGKSVRKIIRINDELCTGCGDCVTSCAEGAIEIIGGKAKLVSDNYCDGLGACIGDCPTGALTIEEREADDFDEYIPEQHLSEQQQWRRLDEIVEKVIGRPQPAGSAARTGCGDCPGTMSQMLERPAGNEPSTDDPSPVPSRLGNWPVQLMLVPVTAPYFSGADLLIAADCASFAHGNFHRKFLAGKTLLIGCHKLDDAGHYKYKLTRIFKQNRIKSVQVLFMEVPCCFGLANLVQQAADASGADFPVFHTKLGIKGNVYRTTEA